MPNLSVRVSDEMLAELERIVLVNSRVGGQENVSDVVRRLITRGIADEQQSHHVPPEVLARAAVMMGSGECVSLPLPLEVRGIFEVACEITAIDQQGCFVVLPAGTYRPGDLPAIEVTSRTTALVRDIREHPELEHSIRKLAIKAVKVAVDAHARRLLEHVGTPADEEHPQRTNGMIIELLPPEAIINDEPIRLVRGFIGHTYVAIVAWPEED